MEANASVRGPSVFMYSILAMQKATLLWLHDGVVLSDERSQGESTGPGRKEVRTMAFAPTCLKCGSILMGYDWDRELNYPVYFCTECGAGAPAQKAAVKAEAA
jgi:hypothetical protein